MRLTIPLLLAFATVAHAAPAAASLVDRVTQEAQLGREFWQARGVTGCNDGFSIEFFDEPPAPAMQGGFCRIRVNLYWLPPNPWGVSRESECALVFHEVKHALPGGETGGVDGQGHTKDGLMAPSPGAVPYECLRWVRPLKGVLRKPVNRKEGRAGRPAPSNRRGADRVPRHGHG